MELVWEVGHHGWGCPLGPAGEDVGVVVMIGDAVVGVVRPRAVVLGAVPLVARGPGAFGSVELTGRTIVGVTGWPAR